MSYCKFEFSGCMGSSKTSYHTWKNCIHSHPVNSKLLLKTNSVVPEHKSKPNEIMFL